MSTLMSADHTELLNTVRQFFQRHSDEAAVRAQMVTDHGYDAAVWQQLTQQLGVAGLIVPEQFGGLGYGLAELAVVAQEAGRALYGGLLLATTMATTLLLALDDDTAAARYLPGIADGSIIATVAHAEPASDMSVTGPSVVASETESGWRLTGTKKYVLHGASADLLLVSGGTDVGISFFAVDAGAPGLQVSSLPTMDLTRKQAAVSFDSTPAVLVGVEGAGASALARMHDLSWIVMAAEQVGGAAKALELAVEYACMRQQFGRPIGSFQAIKHKCADMLLQLEGARSALFLAVEAAVEPGANADLTLQAAIARAVCSEAFSVIAAEAVQIHGGIGFTWECPAQLYLKRATSDGLIFPGPAMQRERIADLIGL